MKIFKYSSHRENELISDTVFTADSFFSRLRGLIFRKPLENGEALLLKDCKSIHTMGMKYGIDAAFINKEGKIISIFENILPWRFSPYVGQASAVVEFKGGFLKEKSLGAGDRILFG